MTRGSFPPVANRSRISCWKAISGGVGLLVLVVAPASLKAQTTWDGGGADNFWVTPENWTGDVAPGTATNVVFGDLDKTDSSTPNSILGVSSTIRTLTFNNTGTATNDWQNVEIQTGQTLSITNGVAVGASGTATNAKISGGGTLLVTGGTFVVRGSSGAATTLDLSSLTNFSSTVSTFIVGTQLGNVSPTLATLTLADNNSITATSLTVGTSTKTSTLPMQNSVLNLGGSNILHIDGITVGGQSSRQGGTIRFAEADGTPTTGKSVTIRGAAGGSSRANLTIGVGTDGNSVPTTSVVDFSGNEVDALFGDLKVGNVSSSSGSSSSPLTGIFSMDAGTVDATSVEIGHRSAGGGTVNAAIGIVNIGGGAFTAGSILMGQTAATNGSSEATLNITGGTVEVNGNVAEGTSAGGTVTSTLNLQGGTLDMKGHAVTVDTFSAESGTLRNLGEFNGGADLVKTTAGTLILDGDNTYTGSSVVNAGMLTLAATGSMEFFIQADGITNALLGSGTVSLDGEFVFNLSGAALEGTWTIVDWSSLAGGFGSTFAVRDWNDAGSGLWEFDAGGGVTYSFSEATGVLTAVPEPGTTVLLGMGFALVLWRAGRRGSC